MSDTYSRIRNLNIDIRWMNRLIGEYQEKKASLKEQLKTEKRSYTVRSINKKIKRYKTIINGFVQFVIDCKAEIKQLQRMDPNNMKKKAL